MAEIENRVLADKSIIPTDDYIFSIIGDKKEFWKSIMTYMTNNYKNSSGEWNYYNDGNRWLFKMLNKKKTVFWISILEDTFRVTFWFSDKAQILINECNLPQSIKDEFRLSKKYGSIRAVTVKILDSRDVDNVLKLIAIKTNLK